MKKIILVLVLILIFFGLLYYRYLFKGLGKLDKIEINGKNGNTETQKIIETRKVEFNNNNYLYSLYQVKDNQKINLISNLENKLSSFQIKEKYNCRTLFNTNFYDTNNHHLGLFKSGNSEYSPILASNFFNGFLYDTDNKFIISKNEPESSSNFVLQSGPILFENGVPHSLKIIDDKEARRVAVLITNNGKLFFVVLFKEEDNISGPFLADLFVGLEEIAKQNNFTIDSALNLDGGSASTFQTQEISLTEVKLVGGFFCIR